MQATKVSAAETAEVLGGWQVFHRKIDSTPDLEAEIARGLPVSSLSATIGVITTSAATQEKLREAIVPKNTYKVRLAENRFNVEESERLERIARVFATARHVLESDDKARDFLNTPHPELGGKRPIDIAVTEPGAQQIENILWSIFFGIPA
jgi:putative toxin-antitoxin system antitoxin component (TIGR02293 family)